MADVRRRRPRLAQPRIAVARSIGPPTARLRNSMFSLLARRLSERPGAGHGRLPRRWASAWNGSRLPAAARSEARR